MMKLRKKIKKPTHIVKYDGDNDELKRRMKREYQLNKLFKFIFDFRAIISKSYEKINPQDPENSKKYISINKDDIDSRLKNEFLIEGFHEYCPGFTKGKMMTTDLTSIVQPFIKPFGSICSSVTLQVIIVPKTTEIVIDGTVINAIIMAPYVEEENKRFLIITHEASYWRSVSNITENDRFEFTLLHELTHMVHFLFIPLTAYIPNEIGMNHVDREFVCDIIAVLLKWSSLSGSKQFITQTISSSRHQRYLKNLKTVRQILMTIYGDDVLKLD